MPDEPGPELCEALKDHAWLQPVGTGAKVQDENQARQQHATVEEFGFVHGDNTVPGQQAIDMLRRWRAEGQETPATKLSHALKKFAAETYSLMVREQAQSRTLFEEAKRLLKSMTEREYIKVRRGDLDNALQALDGTRDWPPDKQTWCHKLILWLTQCVLECSPLDDATQWRQKMSLHLKDDCTSIYAEVDVRAWPLVPGLLGECLNRTAICEQIRLQLCSRGWGRDKIAALHQAADLITEMQLYRDFHPEGDPDQPIYQVFNDKTIPNARREELLKKVLQPEPRDKKVPAPRTLVREVLRRIDEDLDEHDRHDSDPELRMLERLLAYVDEDIRCCAKAFLRLKRNWLLAGVVKDEELTPDQICEHIEDDENYETLLRDAVNLCHKNNRTFEAAKMLSRPKSQTSRAKETLRNDQQIEYLVSLYREVEEPEDRFGPLADASMALPDSPQYDTVYLPENRDGQFTMDNIEYLQEILSSGPAAIGVWWLWRCFDGYRDTHSRAALIAITFGARFLIVDMVALEQADKRVEHEYKQLLVAILEAPHLLKVVHYLERTALRALQLALIEEKDRAGDARPTRYTQVTPAIDLALVVACMHGTSGRASKELPSVVWKYLRLDLCVTEALSNFEHRPLRRSQLHYAITLAWCPVVILHACCAHGVISKEVVLSLSLNVSGFARSVWDEVMHTIQFSGAAASSPLAGNQGAEAEAHGRNIWEDPISVEKLKVDCNLLRDSLRNAQDRAKQLLCNVQESEDFRRAVQTLFDIDISKKELKALYERQDSYNPPWFQMPTNDDVQPVQSE
eukprot:CAMPEP_0181427614 /NCGR_PEP_ID=MMETSP1110-20121109/16261_1 /TAXON_ID=174948 /ORGANISM="Symbiodinium sp., Strain CCMP421" /LENGTH=798 /DNA_ID=CAMNT_0023550829 /DNA_START=97 /DNA_END=2493 /DNA_ORIENTATION=+